MPNCAPGISAQARQDHFCTGNSYTLADSAVGVCLGYLDFRFPQLGWRDTDPNLVRLKAKLAERQSFIATVPRE